MSTKGNWLNGILRFFDPALNHETELPIAPVVFKDDFLQAALDTGYWTARDTAGATEALVADAPSGALALSLTNANEAQLGGVDFGDQRCFVLNQGLNFEARYRFTTLPAGASTAVVGLCGDHNADIDTVAESIWFRHDASGAITVESDDTANESSKVATGVTLLVNTWAIVRIDCTEITNVKFYINGNRVAASTTFDMSTVAALKLQPVARMDKAANAANLGVMELDYVRVWQKRS